MDFQHWLFADVLYGLGLALVEGFQDLGPEAQAWLDEYVTRWGEKAAQSKSDYKRINWTMHWSQPENLTRLKDIVADEILKRGFDRTGFDAAARQFLTNYLATILQKNVGHGSRRNMISARRLGAEPEALAKGELIVPKPAQGAFFTKTNAGRAERWKQYRVQRELSKIPVVDPQTGEILQPSVVPDFKPMGRPKKATDGEDA